MDSRQDCSQRAIVVGASSGLGRALARRLSGANYRLALASRNEQALQAVRDEIGGTALVAPLDLRDAASAAQAVNRTIQALGGLDLLVVTAGVDPQSAHDDWASTEETLKVNVLGTAAVIEESVAHFARQGRGHVVGISSIAAVRGLARSPAYSGSKAFVSNYLEGLHDRLLKRNVFVTDIRLGFVDTPMIAGRKGAFWVVRPEAAAEQVAIAIHRRKRAAYVPARWRLVAAALRALPGGIYGFLNARACQREFGER